MEAVAPCAADESAEDVGISVTDIAEAANLADTNHADTHQEAVLEEAVLAPNASPDLAFRIERAWHECGYRDLRRLRCEDQGGVVKLAGRVGSYFLKQMAQAIAGRMPGVVRIDNQIHVAARA